MADVAIPSSSGGAVVAGVYTGDGAAERTIPLGFTPSAVIISGRGTFLNSNHTYSALVINGTPVFDSSDKVAEIVTGGFKVFYAGYSNTNTSGYTFYFTAFR